MSFSGSLGIRLSYLAQAISNLGKTLSRECIATTASLSGQRTSEADVNRTASYVNSKYPAVPKNPEVP